MAKREYVLDIPNHRRDLTEWACPFEIIVRGQYRNFGIDPDETAKEFLTAEEYEKWASDDWVLGTTRSRTAEKIKLDTGRWPLRASAASPTSS